MTAPKAETATEVVLDVNGMTCGGCESKVKTALMNCDGVTDCEVNWKESKATVMVLTGSVRACPKIQPK